jgi:NAD(P)-dependent dehydrogenase (short-subunit alcohol dehydrogenase family)
MSQVVRNLTDADDVNVTSSRPALSSFLERVGKGFWFRRAAIERFGRIDVLVNNAASGA